MYLSVWIEIVQGEVSCIVTHIDDVIRLWL